MFEDPVIPAVFQTRDCCAALKRRRQNGLDKNRNLNFCIISFFSFVTTDYMTDSTVISFHDVGICVA